MRQIREAVNATGRALVKRNNVGQDQTTHMTYGLGKGSPDLVGTLRNGRWFCLEVKTPTGRISPEQKAWAEYHRREWNVFVCFVTSVDSALAALDRALSGSNE